MADTTAQMNRKVQKLFKAYSRASQGSEARIVAEAAAELMASAIVLMAREKGPEFAMEGCDALFELVRAEVSSRLPPPPANSNASTKVH